MSCTFSIIYSPEARKDLLDIYSYISQELLAPNVAKNQVNKIRKFVNSLDFMPSRNPVVDWEP